MNTARVCAVIPAHNEEKNIETAIMDFVNQTYKVARIVVVDDFSTDGTAAVVSSLAKKYPQVILVRTKKPQLRAGAINEGLTYLMNYFRCNFVVMADADSRFDSHLVEEGIKAFGRSRKIGGICSIAGVLTPTFRKRDGIIRNAQKWILWRLQRLEYAGFDATRTATWKKVLILHGLCSMFRFEAITGVGGYTPNHLLEDYKLTLQLKKAGWQTVFCPKMLAWTKVPELLWDLIRQRLRWMRGGVQIILEEGINKHTFEDAANHGIFIVLLLVILTSVGVSLGGGWQIRLNPSPFPIAFALLGYMYSAYNLKYVRNRDAIDVTMRLSIVPELLLAMLYSALQVLAYIMALLKIKQQW